MPQPISLQSLTASHAPSFDEPFGMLEACHERAHRTLALLQRLRAHLAAHGADTQAQQAARDILRYFDQAAPQHHRDEELHVFPPLLEQGDPQTVAVVRRLQQEHVAMEEGWAQARPRLQEVAEGRLQALTVDDEAALASFAALYERHIRAEEDIAYPRAQRLLDAPQLQAMGQEMAQRRGGPR